ncbi:hypothetical protein K490DRAFT_53919 [Saccharata proteae CBS 121410]|uniref:Amidohydrolase-related domain-containing protein n=1 Tax=Saccharata proteae CBS 121410 TaxID=1314787 RepID=A0A9P4I0U3_9PEZI|nr:hypothetical protein K490DRAFT_53919 [Saccharata proteae CBS 121410]
MSSSTGPKTLLLHSGTALLHSGNSDHVIPTKTDILIRDNLIAEIGTNISHEDVDEIIDCSDMIVSPGFVDCHQHVWQTQLKGRHADHTLMYVRRKNDNWLDLDVLDSEGRNVLSIGRICGKYRRT